MINFVITMVQDLLLTPILFLAFQYILNILAQKLKAKNQRDRISHFIHAKLLDKNLSNLYLKLVNPSLTLKTGKLSKIETLDLRSSTTTTNITSNPSKKKIFRPNIQAIQILKNLNGHPCNENTTNESQVYTYEQGVDHENPSKQESKQATEQETSYETISRNDVSQEISGFPLVTLDITQDNIGQTIEPKRPKFARKKFNKT